MMQESVKKVPLPAVMFNRTPNRERKNSNMSNSKLFAVVTPTRRDVSPSMNSSRRKYDQKQNSRMGNSRIQGEVCMNHQYKQASYSVIGECGKYCQKCAIFMASQGFKVKKISSQDILSKQRKQQLQSISKQVDETLRTLGTKKVQTTQCQIHCKQTFQQQTQIAEQYFLQLHKVVDYYRQQTLKYIEYEYSQSQRVQKQLQQILQQSINDTNSIRHRLSPNDSNSVFNLEDEKLDASIELFKMRLNNYKKTVRSWKAQDIVIKPINLCDINHISAILNDLYHKDIILYEQPDSQCRQEIRFDDDIILEEQTITEDDMQI